jgi:hypothetical protein
MQSLKETVVFPSHFSTLTKLVIIAISWSSSEEGFAVSLLTALLSTAFGNSRSDADFDRKATGTR